MAAVLAVRIVWGFVGTRYARFNDFVPGPRRLREYLALLARGREPRQLGHNPAAAVMMLVLMALLAAVSVTGWMMRLWTPSGASNGSRSFTKGWPRRYCGWH